MQSARRMKERAAAKTKRAAAMGNPGGESVYARKRRGIYPLNSPRLTGNWGLSWNMIEDQERRRCEAAAGSLRRLSAAVSHAAGEGQ